VPSHSIEPSRAHPVGAVFVLLHLLEGNPEGVTKIALGQTKLKPALADAPTHVVVYIRGSFCHCAAPEDTA